MHRAELFAPCVGALGGEATQAGLQLLVLQLLRLTVDLGMVSRREADGCEE